MFKRILLTMVMVLFTTTALAAGSCVETGSRASRTIISKTLTCTADAADGTVANYTLRGFTDYYLYTVETWPGSTAPTDASDMTILSMTGEDLMGGNGTDLIDNTSSLSAIPKSANMSLNLYPLVQDNLTVTVTQAAAVTNSAIMYIRITGVR